MRPAFEVCCLTCHHSTLRDKDDEKRDRSLRAMARAGFINCLASEGRALFKPFGARCGKFAPLEPESASKRVEWASKTGMVSSLARADVSG